MLQRSRHVRSPMLHCWQDGDVMLCNDDVQVYWSGNGATYSEEWHDLQTGIAKDPDGDAHRALTLFLMSRANEIIPGQVYLGNLSAAESQEYCHSLGITHILSVCPENPSTGPHHLCIPIDDSEYEDILIHLPAACEFIQHALNAGGRVLVHCVMGVSRSVTVVAAYLMKTRKMSRRDAVHCIKQRRPQAHPNYGFIRQLQVFADCAYAPRHSCSVYTQWKRQHRRVVTRFLTSVLDTTCVVPDRVYLGSEFPRDEEQAESLLLDLGITHLLTVAPAAPPLPPEQRGLLLPTTTTVCRHVQVDESREGAGLLDALPEACAFVCGAVEEGGRVLVHSLAEWKACVVVCAFLMVHEKLSSAGALAVIQDALPLFIPTATFSRHVELFEACVFRPGVDHPLVVDWVRSETETVARA